MHCLCYNALLQTGLLFMYPIIVQPYANVYFNTPTMHLWCLSPCGLSNECLTIKTYLLQMYLIVITGQKFTACYPTTVATVKCPSDNDIIVGIHTIVWLLIDGSYTVMQCTKTKVIHYYQYKRSNSQTAFTKIKQSGYVTLDFRCHTLLHFNHSFQNESAHWYIVTLVSFIW